MVSNFRQYINVGHCKWIIKIIIKTTFNMIVKKQRICPLIVLSLLLRKANGTGCFPYSRGLHNGIITETIYCNVFLLILALKGRAFYKHTTCTEESENYIREFPNCCCEWGQIPLIERQRQMLSGRQSRVPHSRHFAWIKNKVPDFSPAGSEPCQEVRGRHRKLKGLKSEVQPEALGRRLRRALSLSGAAMLALVVFDITFPEVQSGEKSKVVHKQNALFFF